MFEKFPGPRPTPRAVSNGKETSKEASKRSSMLEKRTLSATNVYPTSTSPTSSARSQRNSLGYLESCAQTGEQDLRRELGIRSRTGSNGCEAEQWRQQLPMLEGIRIGHDANGISGAKLARATSLSSDELSLGQLERKFAKLAVRYRRSMLLCGLFQDVTLLFADEEPETTAHLASREMCNSQVCLHRNERAGALRITVNLRKLVAFGLVLIANLTALYVLVAHFIWEFRMLDAKNSNQANANPTTTTTTTQQQQTNTNSAPNNANNNLLESSNSKGWSVLKEFLENLRRHILRLFTFALTLTWHLNYRQIELLFIDCRRYHAYFYRPTLTEEPPKRFVSTVNCRAEDSRNRPGQFNEDSYFPEKRQETESPRFGSAKVPFNKRPEKRRQLLEATGNFYRLANRRIQTAIWLPALHFLFYLFAISSFPSSDKRRPGRWPPRPAGSGGGGPRASFASSSAAAAAAAFYLADPATSTTQNQAANEWWRLPGNLLEQAIDNFDSFHLAVHTAFHPHDHHIRRIQHGLNFTGLRASTSSANVGANGLTSSTSQQSLFAEHHIQSATFCLLELLIYSLYFHGPQVFCATCLSLVLNIHHQCLSSFNQQLIPLIKRGKEWPLTSSDIVKLVKQYDLIAMMHVKIERTFKWSIVIWYSLMFISCLMHIFSFTESTSAYVVSHQAGNAQSASQNLSANGNQQTNQSHLAGGLRYQTSIAIQLIRLGSLFFVCYSPYLIYSEAFKIESASGQTEQLVMRLASRQDDPLAQSIEPSLFEPIHLSVGDYFHLSKKSMSSFLGAIVTFSVMFIADRPEEVAHRRPGDGPAIDMDVGEDLFAGADDDDVDDVEETNEDEEADDDGQRDHPEPEPEPEPLPGPGSRLVQRGDDDDDDEDNNDEDDNESEEEHDELTSAGGRRMAAADGVKKANVYVGSRQERRLRLGLAPPRHKPQAKWQHPPEQPELGSGQPNSVIGPAGDDGVANSSSRTGSGQADPPARRRRKFKRLRQHLKLVAGGPSVAPAIVVGRKRGANSRRNGQLAMVAMQSASNGQVVAPKLERRYAGRVRENERLVELQPKLRTLNAAEVCDIELQAINGPSLNFAAERDPSVLLPFVVSWIDRVNGEASLEAKRDDLMDCERQRNYTFKMRAIGCNGLASNEALVVVTLEDVNEFSPDFERLLYTSSLNLSEDELQGRDVVQWPKPRLLTTVRARDLDCSSEFHSICRYELLPGAPIINQAQVDGAGGGQQQSSSHDQLEGLSVDLAGRVWLRHLPWAWLQALRQERAGLQQNAPVANQQPSNSQPSTGNNAATLIRSFQVIAHDCGGKKSQLPATIQLSLNRLCRASFKDVDTQLAYSPGDAELWPFLRARLDLCGAKCHRPNISVALQLQTTDFGQQQQPPTTATTSFHCDREPYSMASKRRLCGARNRIVELLPTTPGENRKQQHLQQHLQQRGRWSDLKLRSHGSDGPAGSKADGSPEGQQPAGLESESGGGEVENGDHNLASYSPEGAYGRLAVQFANSARSNLDNSNQQNDDEDVDGDEDARWPSSLTGTGSAQPNEDGRQQAASIREGSGTDFERLISKRSVAGRSKFAQNQHNGPSLAEKWRRRNQWNQSWQQHQRQTISPGSLYRDQVYRFDGATSALLVPKSSLHDSETLASSGASGGNDNGASWRPYLFGRKHTISFWMRHKPFRFAANNRSGNSNSSLDDLAKHVKEHLICATTTSAGEQVGPDESVGSNQAHDNVAEHWPAGHKHRHQHQYALYLRNCKLVLMMRQSGVPTSQSNSSSSWPQGGAGYVPAEWRWSLTDNATCDNKWHLYTINVHYPQVELYVDGRQFVESYDNLVIVDSPAGFGSQPVDQVADGYSALAVGACQEPRQLSWSGHFRGSLSGLIVLLDENDSSSAIECLGQCTEQLVSVAPSGSSGSKKKEHHHHHHRQEAARANQQVDDLTSGDEPNSASSGKLDNSLVAYQESQSRISLQGHDFIDVEEALTQIAYLNQRQLPSIGKRSILVSTQITCLPMATPFTASNPSGASSTSVAQIINSSTELNNASANHHHHSSSFNSNDKAAFSIPIEPMRIEVNVLPSSSLPVISISGTPNLAREYGPFMEGIRPFSSVILRVKRLNLIAHSPSGSPGPVSLETSRQRLHPSHQNRSQVWPATKLQPTQTKSTGEETGDYIEDSVWPATEDGEDSKQVDWRSRTAVVSPNLEPPTGGEQEKLDRVSPVDDLGAVKKRIESCSVALMPPLDTFHETLQLPLDQINQLQLYWFQSNDGFTIYGLDSADNYERLLRATVYRNQQPAKYTERVFSLVCSDMNGRLISNEYLQTVTMIHLKPELAESSDFMVAKGAYLVEPTRDTDKGVSMLKSSPLPQVSIGAAPEESQLEPVSTPSAGGKGFLHHLRAYHQPLAMLNLEQSTKLNRIAMACLVFVVSLIVILLVIAITNLKEPSLSNCPPIDGFQDKRRWSNSDGSESYDIDSAQPTCYFSEAIDEEDEEEEDEDERDELDEVGKGFETHQKQQVLVVVASRDNKSTLSASTSTVPSRISSRRTTTTEQDESLVWDDELERAPATTIVMNPILHGNRNERELRRTFVIEQRPNKNGSMTGRSKTHLSYHSPVLVGAGGDDGELDCFEEDDLIPLDEIVSTSCSSTSSSSESDSECECSSKRKVSACVHFRGESQTENEGEEHDDDDQDDDDDEEEDDEELSWNSEHQYELYHRHHLHHTCIKRRHQRAPIRQACSPVAAGCESLASFDLERDHAYAATGPSSAHQGSDRLRFRASMAPEDR